MKASADLLAIAVAALALACASGDTTDFEGSGGDTSASASGGGGSGPVGTGGSALPCGVDCAAIATPQCQLGRCNTTTQQCEVIDDEDGVACDDGLFCTISDSCLAGMCEGGPPNDCGMSPPACSEVTCDESAQSCGTAPAMNGAACQEPDLCIKGSTCSNGLCLGGMLDTCFFTPVPECHIAVCDSADGVCKPQIGPDNDPCTDPNDPCTVNKTCMTGVCQGGSPKDCSALTMGCVLGVCDVNNGQCIPQNLMNNDPCDDLDACTTGETCQNGSCVNGAPVTTCMSGDSCCPSNCNVNNDPDCAMPVYYGLDTEFTTASNHSPNYLLGNAIVVTSAMTLTHLSIISKQTGPNVKIGLYNDLGGNPNALIAQTPSTAVVLGVNDIPISPMALPAGTYWFMAVFNTSGSVGIRHGMTSDVVKYVSHSFANPLPTTFPSPTTYNGQGFNYYVRGLP